MTAHWFLYHDWIIVDNGNDGYTVIAKVINRRSCQQMLSEVSTLGRIEDTLGELVRLENTKPDTLCPDLSFISDLQVELPKEEHGNNNS